MHKTCCSAVDTPVIRATPVAIAIAAMLVLCSPADAASLGHSRLLSAPGQPLHIDIPIRELNAADVQSLRVSAAPATAWRQAGLVPPVELSSLRFNVGDGFTPDSRVIQVRSSQPFDGPVADLLLQVDTAAGSQQHQVSLLAYASRPGAATANQAASSGQGPALGAQAAAATSRSISVRRGDILFALAQANAVEGISVYQMMVALQRANPQAFIDGNMNLVKAGAKLSVPDAAGLRAVSDREARRIFQQHVQAYAAYRQDIAARRGAAVQGGSTEKGSVSNGRPSASVSPTSAQGDRVVLSSGADSDTARDEQDATQQNISESEARVSQLERNVQSLNQALQMQGEAAKDAVLDGAAAVSQTLAEATNGTGPSTGETAAQSSSTQTADSAQAGTASGLNSNAAPTAAGASLEAQADSSAGDSPAAPAAQTNVADGDAGSAATAPDNSTTSTSNQAEQSVSWFQENLLGVITAILALVVLIIAWVLRRASASRSDEGQGGVTEAMVQERLEKIDLNFDNPPADGRPPHTS